ncbi:hypothetical protein [Campylobacter geochelonis]|uniref:hypothetical protein n=1 Tax=Campylobacter geochelonis TaxID=1780362 RepID=UPI000770771D|nr:hypothetical protein [Campylobacter geochelonis]CZE48201.1 prophage MuSo1%2C F protein [Campylobacter geochelonis]
MLSLALLKTASKFLDIQDKKRTGVLLTKDKLSHASPKRKDAYGHSFKVEEMREIVNVLNNEENAYIDLRDGHNNILFIFEDKKDKTKLNLIPIEVIKKHKKFKDDNFIITLDKVDKEGLEAEIKGNRITKVK